MVDPQYLFELLKKHYPKAKMILQYGNNWELLVAVVLSAQCTDAMVNKVTAIVFPKYRKKYQVLRSTYQEYGKQTKISPNELIEIVNFAFAPLEELEQDIKSTGFYRAKAKNVQAAAKVVLEKFGGKLPKTIAQLTTIPGVGRKTANVVLGNAYGIYEGIAVDTHVRKQTQLFGLTQNTTPEKIEKDLMRLFPQKQWFPLTYLLIEHGRAVRFKKTTACTVCHGPCQLLARQQ